MHSILLYNTCKQKPFYIKWDMLETYLGDWKLTKTVGDLKTVTKYSDWTLNI